MLLLLLTASTCYSFPLYYELKDKDLAQFTEEREGNGFLINLIGSPEHTGFFNGPGVIAAMRIGDGVLFLVDCVSGKYTYKVLMLLYNNNIIMIISRVY